MALRINNNFFLVRQLLLLICFLFINKLYSINIDSLKHQLVSLEARDKIEALNKLCWELKYVNQNEALNYGLEGLDLARSLSNERLEAELLKTTAIVYLISGEFNAAEDNCKKALILFQKQKNVLDMANVSNTLGLINANKGLFEKAIVDYDKSVLLFKALGDSSRVIAVDANIANVYYKKGEFQKAIPYYERIVVDAKQKNDIQKLGINLYNLGITYTQLGDYPKALEYLFEASDIYNPLGDHYHWIKAQNEIGLVYRRLDLIEEAIELYELLLIKAIEMDNKILIASLNNNLGLCYYNQGRIAESLKCYTTSFRIYDSLGVQNIGHILNNIGRVHQTNKNYKEALKFFNQAIQINSTLDIQNNLALDWSNIGGLFLEQNEYAKAENYLLKAFAVLERTKELKELAAITELLAVLYQNLKQEKEAIKYRNLNRQYSESLFNKKKIFASNRIIIQAKLKEKNAYINKSNEQYTLLEKEQIRTEDNNKRLSIWIIILIVLILFGVYYYRNKVLDDQKILAKDLVNTQSEKNVLQNTLKEQNRAMVFSSLEMIQKEEMIQNLKVQLKAIAKNQPDNASEIRNLLNKLNINDVISKDWSYFNDVFNKAFPDFTLKVRKAYPNISRKELQHCVLIKLNTPPVEAANILGISTESVHTARYRLRKKLKLERQDKLEDAILSI